ncbi:MAG TPA: DUF1684 domain-containing protein [Ignavibacteriaceae bacterium]|nr:DUF1684 domain-containing protein [Ignavibacteriaceae bacterium]
MNNKIIILLMMILSVTLFSCGNNYSPDQKKYIGEIEKVRAEKNDFMKNNLSSPFNQDTEAEFHPLKYYDVNPNFIFKSKIFPFAEKDTVKVMGTKGEERQAVKYGYVKFDYKGNEYKINVYKGWTKSGEEYYSIWFTDETTGKETYNVGRYLDFELKADPDYIYTIDFNLAYNPYCAYSAKFSCAVPTKEDYIALAIEAGEKKFHN